MKTVKWFSISAIVSYRSRKTLMVQLLIMLEINYDERLELLMKEGWSDGDCVCERQGDWWSLMWRNNPRNGTATTPQL